MPSKGHTKKVKSQKKGWAEPMGTEKQVVPAPTVYPIAHLIQGPQASLGYFMTLGMAPGYCNSPRQRLSPTAALSKCKRAKTHSHTLSEKHSQRQGSQATSLPNGKPGKWNMEEGSFGEFYAVFPSPVPPALYSAISQCGDNVTPSCKYLPGSHFPHTSFGCKMSGDH